MRLTGSDDVQISKPDDFEDLFAPDSNGAHKKALLQLLLYCNAYATHEHYADDITPVIYKFRDVDKCLNGKYDIQQSYLNGKSIRYKPVDGYLNDLKNDKFLERIRKVIRDIFDKDVPFVQTEHKSSLLLYFKPHSLAPRFFSFAVNAFASAIDCSSSAGVAKAWR